MIRLILAAALVAYVPGALIYRLPTGDRARRAELPAEERVFWHVVLSAAWSLGVVLALAWCARYSFNRLLLADAGLAGAVLAAGRGRLRYGGLARRPSWTAALPVALIVVGVAQFLPTSEYIIGGKDPGTYINEGVQIAQRGSIVIHDPVVAAVPDVATPLFFPLALGQPYDSLRFMGFFVSHLRAGEVVGQLPHLFPASIAIGYGLNGLTGARLAVAAWATLGLVAVYMFGARTFGPAPAIAASALLALNVIDVWFGRYPNSEVAMQALFFAALLACSRAHEDAQPFFGPVVGVLVMLLVFARLDGLLVAAALAGATVLSWIATDTKPRLGFVVTLVGGVAIGLAYLAGPLRAYFQTPLNFTDQISRPLAALALLAALAALAALIRLRRRHAEQVRRVVPIVIAVALLVAAAYALFLRAPGGKLTDYDAYALRTFTQFFFFPSALLVALAGILVVATHSFWRAPAFLVAFATFALVFFYKIHVVPEHFWMERRTLSIILPGALLLVGVAAVGDIAGGRRTWRLARRVVGAAFLIWLGMAYAAASRPLRSHVEYAGIIPYLEQLAGRIGDRDLTIVESRDAGPDTHVFAVPLAYIYARNVLVLASPKPDKLRLEAFIEDARQKYDRVLFLGGQGTDLLSRRIIAAPLADGRVQVPEYASTPWNVYPEGARRKEFDYSLYQLSIGERGSGGGFHLDVGDRDDLFVLRFNAKERSEGRTIRWTGPTSYISMPGLSGAEREVVLTMHDGGRPTAAPPARVTVRFNGTILGTLDVKPGFQEYRLAIPAELARAAGDAIEPAQLTLESTVWVPRDYLGGNDTRRLGVMIDRVDVN